MQPNKNKDGSTASAKPTIRQLIACAVALCIVGLGVLSLLGQQAPYHPDLYEEEVTRGASGMTGAPQSD